MAPVVLVAQGNNMNELLHEEISKALATLGLPEAGFVVEYPDNPEHGDYSSNVALVLAKQSGQKPREVAERIKEVLLDRGIEGVAAIEVAGAGFINFKLSNKYFTEVLQRVLREGDRYGRNTTYQEYDDHKQMIEYTDPNPFKVFHIGHLMSNAIGEFISRIREFSGAEVKRANYQGDIGLHVAKAIWGLQTLNGNPEDIKAISDGYVFGSKEYEHNSKAKDEIEVLNQGLYKHDPELQEIYVIGRQTSLKHFEEIYKKLGTDFDYYFFESEVAERGLATVRKNPDIFIESDGATIFKAENFDTKLHTRVFINKIGLPTYEAKELGLIQAKYEKYNFDRSITITANEQSDYFRVVMAAMNLVLPELGQKVRHIAHGVLRFADRKMSSRTGDVITGESLINDVEKLARGKMKTSTHLDASQQEKTATDIAVGAIKYSILRQAIGKDIIFDFEKSLSFEGDSGPYLQYTFARTQSLLTKGKEAGLQYTVHSAQCAESEMPVARLLERFPSEARRALEEYAPQRICTYLIELASAFNAYYAANKIVDPENKELSKERLALTAAVGVVLKSGLWLLGIRAPERM